MTNLPKGNPTPKRSVSNWPRSDKLTLAAILVAVIFGVTSFVVPEVRKYLLRVPEQDKPVIPPITIPGPNISNPQNNNNQQAGGAGNPLPPVIPPKSHNISFNIQAMLTGHSNPITSVSWASNGRYIVTGSTDGTVKFWGSRGLGNRRDFASWRELRVQKLDATVNFVALSPDGHSIVLGGTDAIARVWTLGFSDQIKTISHGVLVNSAAWSPDGKYIVMGCDDNNAKIWDVGNATQIRTLAGHTDPVTSVAWSPDGKYILTGSEDKTARVWDAVSGAQIRTLTGHTEMVTSVAWSPDGKYILTGSKDKTARVWDAVSGEQIQMLKEHTETVTSVAWSPDSKHIVTGSGDNIARIWKSSTDL